MTTTAAPYVTALIPERRQPNGPITTARLRRSATVYAALFLSGLSLALLTSSTGLQAFGLGLVLPGGGFLLYAAGGPLHLAIHAGLFVLSIALFLVALFAWFGSGNVLAPIVVWVGSALWAGAMGHVHIWEGAALAVPTIVLGGAAAALIASRRALAAATRRRDARNAYLAASTAVATPLDASGALPRVEELSPSDLAVMRFALDRALQPIDEFSGFDWIEQFQTASVRYQVMTMSYALSLAQFARTPSLRGYLSQAQVNLIEKMRDHRVWSYWAWENAWGNLRLDPDPMAPRTHDNVMYSGWYAAMIGMYASNTGDGRYDKPGAITLRHPGGREFVYDFPHMVRILTENFRRADFTLFPCEPNWIYLMCNNFAGVGLKIHDRLTGSENWAEIEPRFRRSLDQEFLTVDGRIVAIRSARTGLTIPALTSTMADAGSCIFLHALVPEVARRSWEIVRHDLLDLNGERVEIDLRGWDKIDTGNYRRSTATTLAATMAGAVEMGDPSVARAVRERFEEEHPPVTEGGVIHHPGVSVIGHVSSLLERVGRTNGMRDLVGDGVPDVWRDGPMLDEVDYPATLVAKAVSDGRALDAVLYPGADPGRRTLGLAQLRPGRRYRCEGAVSREVVADGVGRAHLQVDLEQRTELRVLPAE
ncbi:MAG: hypothetical protein QNK04_32605 [Myxococcota bacterium]|nr:hypothetical protein [Myxococcota bacterium]